MIDLSGFPYPQYILVDPTMGIPIPSLDPSTWFPIILRPRALGDSHFLFFLTARLRESQFRLAQQQQQEEELHEHIEAMRLVRVGWEPDASRMRR